MRGDKLDTAITECLVEMLAKGETISRSAVQKKLSLSSRSTLVGKRAKVIDEAREKQISESGASDAKYHRLSLLERCKRLSEDNKKLEKSFDELNEKLIMIVVNAEKYGLSPEKMLEPLAPKRRTSN